MIGNMFHLILRHVLLVLVVAAALIVGCGASEPPLPSVPIPAPSLTAILPDATATAPPPIPTSTPIPPAPPSDSSGITLTIAVAPLSPDMPQYDRGDWSHWRDGDRDCQDARQEALIAESLAAVVYESAEECRVETGEWFGAYTGESFTDPADLDIDHMVPLANAHRSGGWAWSKERKREYANDLSYPNHLIAVKASANRQKGGKGPEDWKPPRREYWCEYAIDWTTIKATWGLTATQSEAYALREMLATCDEPITLLGIPSESAPAPKDMPKSPTATPIPTSDVELRYDPDGPDRNCGDFDTWEEAQAFYIAAGGPDADPHRLDGNKDGSACDSLR